MRIWIVVLLNIWVLSACNDGLEVKKEEEVTLNELQGKWQLFEQGYSPGAGYIINEIDANPPQLITLHQGIFESNYPQLENFHYYLIFDDPQSGMQVLSLYQEEPDLNSETLENAQHSYLVKIEEDHVKLFFRYCIEGCHLGMRKLCDL